MFVHWIGRVPGHKDPGMKTTTHLASEQTRIVPELRVPSTSEKPTQCLSGFQPCAPHSDLSLLPLLTSAWCSSAFCSVQSSLQYCTREDLQQGPNLQAGLSEKRGYACLSGLSTPGELILSAFLWKPSVSIFSSLDIIHFEPSGFDVHRGQRL